MVNFIVRAKVADFAQWRTAFDAGEPIRRAAGATGVSHVYRDADDPNTVTFILEWDTADNARKWMNDPALKERQQKAGVVGAPVVAAILTAA